MSEKEVLVISYFAVLTLILVFLGFTVIVIILYEKKRAASTALLQSLSERYEKEVLRVQLEVQDQTLEHISREVHDSIGSSVSIAKAYLKANLSPEEKLSNLSDILDKTLEDIRGLSKGLSLETIRKLGLNAAIADHIVRVRKIVHYQVDYTVTGAYDLLDEQVEIIAFRILQESINNTIRHAQANRIGITMTCAPDNLILDIRDDGKGFDPRSPSHQGGLAHMRTRASLIGATLTIDSNPNGTTIRLRIALPSTAAK
jgi:signal transduction histidine kinase